MRNQEMERRTNRRREGRYKTNSKFNKIYKLEVLEKYTYESESAENIGKILNGYINYG